MTYLNIAKQHLEYMNTELWRKEQEIEELKDMIKITEDFIRNKCKHKIVYGDIENNKLDTKITYCKKCNLHF